VEHQQATAKILGLLARVAGQSPPLDLVRAVSVYGSYASGALTPADVDLDLELALDDPRVEEMLESNDGLEPLLELLCAGDPTLSLSFNLAEEFTRSGFTVISIWRRGQDLAVSHALLERIVPDSSRGSAPRHYALPGMPDLDAETTIADRRLLSALLEHDVISLEQRPLAEAVEPSFPALASALAPVRALREAEVASWLFVDTALLLRRRECFATVLGQVLDEQNLVWHDLLWEEE
jgi:hypothetical protein